MLLTTGNSALSFLPPHTKINKASSTFIGTSASSPPAIPVDSPACSVNSSLGACNYLEWPMFMQEYNALIVSYGYEKIDVACPQQATHLML